jgi:Uma2 family endonuclease
MQNLDTKQPDLFVFLRGRHDVSDLEALLDQPVIEFPPNIAIEILSRNETCRMRSDKLEDYRHISVMECWIASPQAQTVEVLRLSSKAMHTVGIYGTGMHLSSTHLEELSAAIRNRRQTVGLKM